MIYQLAICDDSHTDAAYVEQLASAWAKAQGVEVQVDVYPSAEAFLMREARCDILLLDIEMGGMDGVTLARAIRRADDMVQIIFISGYSEYIAEGYDVSALHYLIKPISQAKLFEVLSRAVDRLARDARTLLLESGGESVSIPLRDITHLEVLRNYTTVHTQRDDFTVKRTLNELEKQLDESFFRLGRSFIIRLSAVRRVSRAQVELFDGQLIPLPRGMYDALNRAIINQH